jgi:hypothetical protein
MAKVSEDRRDGTNKAYQRNVRIPERINNQREFWLYDNVCESVPIEENQE